MRSPFERRRDGTIEVRLSDVEAQALRRVAADLSDAVPHADDPVLARLFPPAYPDDPDRQAGFEELTRGEAVEGKVAAARAMVASIEGGTTKRARFSAVLDEEQAGCWLRTLNDARLVLGTRLDITEEDEHRHPDPSDPQAPSKNLYLYLSGMLELLVEALAEALPEVSGADG